MRLLRWTFGLIVAAHAGVAVADELPMTLPESRDRTPSIVTLRSVHLRGLNTNTNAAPREPRDESGDGAVRGRPINRFQAAKGGFKYQDRFELNGREYRYNVRGPVQANKRFGLTFELRF
jgi:hypothetical protein